MAECDPMDRNLALVATLAVGALVAFQAPGNALLALPGLPLALRLPDTGRNGDADPDQRQERHDRRDLRGRRQLPPDPSGQVQEARKGLVAFGLSALVGQKGASFQPPD